MKKFAVFDIDGTLIRWQLYHAVANNFAKKGLFGKDGQQQLKSLRMKWKNREHAQAFKEYERALVKMFDTAIIDIDPKIFEKAVEEVVSEYKLQVYSYTRDLIKQLKDKDYFLLAVSGSQQEIVEPIAREYQFDDWLGSTYEQVNGKFTGKKVVIAKDKRTALNKLVIRHGLTYKNSIAVGDTYSDIPMLEAVDYPIAFNPEEQLYTKAIASGWTIVVERKNVIYRLGSKNGRYILA